MSGCPADKANGDTSGAKVRFKLISMSRHALYRINELAKDQAYKQLGPALERLLAAQKDDPNHVKTLIAEMITLLLHSTDKAICYECSGTGFIVEKQTVLQRLMVTAKPVHFFEQPPGKAAEDHRWICCLCSGQKHIRKSTNDMRRHLKTHHGASNSDLATIFSPSNKLKLYEHFGPCTKDQALLNGWRVPRWDVSGNSFTETATSLFEHIVKGSSFDGGRGCVDPALTVMSTNADFCSLASEIQAEDEVPSKQTAVEAREDDAMGSSMISSAGSQFDGLQPIGPMPTRPPDLVYSSYANENVLTSSGPSRIDLTDIHDTPEWTASTLGPVPWR